MARITVRYLTARPGKPGELLRYFWQPSSELRAQGWKPERVPLNWASFTDAGQLEDAAIARARELNDHLDQTRSKAALTATRPAPPIATRTLGDLIKLYQASEEFTGLAASTQRGYRQCLAKLSDWGADIAVRAIDTVRIQRLKKGLAATPAYANAVVRVLRLLLAFGRHQGWVYQNAAEKPGLIDTNASGLIWPAGAVDVFVAAADAMGNHSMGTAVLLNEWLAQRQGDILRMPRSVIRNGSLVIQQSKTGAGVTLPYAMVDRLNRRMTAELARHAAREAAGAPAVTTIIVHEDTGRPYQTDTFRHVFARVRAKAAETQAVFEVDYLMPGRDMTDPAAFQIRMEDLTFMHLRHTGVTRLAEAGCSPSLIASISGHAEASVSAIIERYRVRTAQMARLAFQNRMDAEAPTTPIASTIAGGSQ